MSKRWEASPRRKVLVEVLIAHHLGLFSVAIPTAIAQAEGLVAEAIIDGSSPNHVRNSALLEFVLRPEPKPIQGPRWMSIFEGFARSLLETTFQHGPPQTAGLHRHEIMHGGSYTYGNRNNSIKAILWVDYLLIKFAAEDQKL